MSKTKIPSSVGYTRASILTAELKKQRAQIRTAVADYMQSEGCSCCRDSQAHDEHRERLGKLLNVRKYKDGSGYDFSRHRTKTKRKTVKKKSKPNYVVITRGLSGRQRTECETVEEVYAALGQASFGALTSVDSPRGLDVSIFVPR